MLVKIYDKNPSERDLQRVIDSLESDGVVVLPTDGVYVMGCSLRSAKGVARLRAMSGKASEEMSVIFADIATIAEYCRVDNSAFRVLKRNLPGAFTFILPASSRMPDKVMAKRRTVGVRMPDNGVLRAISERLEVPIIAVSIKEDDWGVEYTTDPSLIEERYGHDVDIVVDGGIGIDQPTTIVDLTDGDVEVVRQGGGELA